MVFKHLFRYKFSQVISQKDLFIFTLLGRDVVYICTNVDSGQRWKNLRIKVLEFIRDIAQGL